MARVNQKRGADKAEDGELPPPKTYAEQCLLACILLDGIAFERVGLRADEFGTENHRRIFQRMEDLHKRGAKIDRVTLSEELRRHHQLESVNGLSYLVSLDEQMPEIPNPESYIRIIADRALRVRLIRTAQTFREKAKIETEPLDELIAWGGNMFTQLDSEQRRDDGAGVVIGIPSPWGYEDRMSYLIDDLLIANAVTMWSGESGDGKSTLALALAAAVAQGHPFLGRSTVQRPVLYMDRENPIAIIKERLDRLQIPDISDQLKIWGPWWQDHYPPGPDAVPIIAYARRFKPLIVWDSLIAFANADENSSKEMRAHMTLYRRLADSGATMLVLHHRSEKGDSKQPKSKYRGSSDIRAAVDAAWEIAREDGSTAADPLARMRITPYKTRNQPGKSIRIEYRDGAFIPLDAPARPAVDIVIGLVACNPGANQKELIQLADKQGLSFHRFLDALEVAILAKRIEVRVGRHNTRRHFLPEPTLEQSA